MVKTEYFMTREDGVSLIRTYSDENYYIHKVGTDEVYAEAIDVDFATWTYEETTIKIEDEENGEGEIDPNEATIADYQDGLRELGVEI